MEIKHDGGTEKLYLTEHDLFETSAKVTAIEIQDKFPDHKVIRLDRTIFHPKGGGQAHDQGTINGKQVELVMKDGDTFNFDVIHFLKNDDVDFAVGDQVSLVIDSELRTKLSCLHTAGHLIANMAKTLFELEYLKCNLDPLKNMTYLMFINISGQKKWSDDALKLLQDRCNQIAQENPPITEQQGASGLREIKIGELSPFPCAGTHTKTLQEISPISIFKMSHKRDTKDSKKVDAVKIDFDAGKKCSF